jgi:carboxypeptidase C (cathepsin A)
MINQRSVFILVCALVAGDVWHAARAEENPAATGAPENEACQTHGAGDSKAMGEQAPRAQSSVTSHHFAVGAQSFDYTATAGALLIRNDDDKPVASIGYVAYTRPDAKSANQRPVLFAFNGGPGSSSIWLHMGLLGPKRVLVADAAPTPPAPFKTVDNEFSLLDRADVVMIDAVGTGLSHAVCGKKDADFWGVDADIDSISRFIAQYVSDNNRWSSPKYLLGESYGTTRAAAVVDYLRAQRQLTFNGLVLVSVAMDLEAISTRRPGNDRPYATYLPSFAAAGWYYHLVSGQTGPLEPFLAEVRRYAKGPFAAALMKGNALSEAERDAVAEQVHKYTGLSADYVKAAHLRVSGSAFAQELLRSQNRILSGLDARFTGPTQDPLQKTASYDPLLADIGPAFTAAFEDYFHRDLKFGVGQTYKVYPDTDISEHWNYSHRPIGVEGVPQTLVNSGVDLAQTLVQDPNLKVLVLNGYFDLGTPFATTEYMISHLQIPRDAVSRIQMKYYAAGHMMYVNPPALRQLKVDLDSFLDSTH